MAILVVADGLVGSPVGAMNLAGVLPCVSKAGLKARSALAARSARDAIGRLARRHA